MQEKALLQDGGAGTRNWTAQERDLILKTPNKSLTSVMSRAGYTGHHINSVEGNGTLGSKWQGDPRNIVFLKIITIPTSSMSMSMVIKDIEGILRTRRVGA